MNTSRGQSVTARSRAAVIGLARSGVAAARLLAARGAVVRAFDQRGINDGLENVVRDLEARGVAVTLDARAPRLRDFELVVLSPGVDPHQEFILEARAFGASVIGEMELGARESRGRIVAVTGTKGKSTTTAVLAAMLRAAGRDARAVGNIGDPISAHAETTTGETILVVEASSFQLETTETFDPRTTVFLNFFPDHLDRHVSIEAYAEAKARVFRNQTKDDVAIVNEESEVSMGLASRTRARILPFRPSLPLDASEPGATAGPARHEAGVAGFASGCAALGVANATRVALFPESSVRVRGAHQRGNLLAAATGAHTEGASPHAITRAVEEFRGLPNAFESLGETRGVVFINDSKATTIDSVAAALRACDAPVIAIMGGRLKAGSFDALRDDPGAARLKAVCAIGESRSSVAAALHDLCPVHLCDTMENAVETAWRLATPGDYVLLSPGGASFDMFENYAARGDAFRRAFEGIAKREAA